MTALTEVLEKSLSDNSSLVITIQCNIPAMTLRINDSRQMVFYGIGLDRQHGFTLTISIDKYSNKGKNLLATLNDTNVVVDFKTVEDKTSLLYLKDFGQGISLLEKTIHDLLDKFQNNTSRHPYQLNIHRTDS